jgi:methanogenic corrinoid protein MtbC1
MLHLSSFQSLQLAQKIAAVKHNVAQAIAAESRLAHPDAASQPDALPPSEAVGLHLDFLAGAIQAASPQAFADYLRWTTAWHQARGITAQSGDDGLARLEKHLAPFLLPREREAVSLFLTRTRSAWQQPVLTPSSRPSGDALELTRTVFLSAILDGQRQAALRIVDQALSAGHSHLDLYLNLFTESLYSVGELWQDNEIGVDQEHMATAITQYAIASVYPRTVPVSNHRGNMVVTGVAGELHQIGANLVADAMEAGGWSVRFLGSNLPHPSVLAAVEDCSANILCISTTTVANLPAVAELVRAVRHRLRDRAPKIVLGGLAYRTVPHFARQVGAANAFTDLRSAVSRLCA